MGPAYPVINGGWSNLEEVIEATERIIARGEELAGTTAQLMALAFPAAADAIAPFKAALASYLIGDTPAQLASLEAQKATTSPTGQTFYQGAVNVETLTSLVKRRDFIQHQLEVCENALAPYAGNSGLPPEAFATLAALMETQAAPYRAQLKDIEAEISEVQKYLETQEEKEVVNG
jgi:hypothetical protein